jgi:hypothetical protein
MFSFQLPGSAHKTRTIRYDDSLHRLARYGNMAGQFKTFWDSTGGLWMAGTAVINPNQWATQGLGNFSCSDEYPVIQLQRIKLCSLETVSVFGQACSGAL